MVVSWSVRLIYILNDLYVLIFVYKNYKFEFIRNIMFFFFENF